MFEKIVFILFLAYFTVQGSDVTKGLKLRIQNGDNAKPGDVPYVVRIREETGGFTYRCNGAIINKDYVLTVAHCIYDYVTIDAKSDVNPKYIKVMTGSKRTQPVSIHSVIWMRMHENFVRERSSSIHDIALLKVFPPIKFNALVAPVRLPPYQFEVSPGTEALLAGWGSTTTDKFYTAKSLPEILQTTTLAISSANYCKEKYYPKLQSIYSVQMCTIIPSGLSRSACKGDSGSPLTINRNTLVGIASTSPQSDESCSEYPTIYTKVSRYTTWIKENMKASKESDNPSELTKDRCSQNRDCLIFD